MANFLNYFDDMSGANPLEGAGITLSGDISRDQFENDIGDHNEGVIFLALAYTSAFNPATAIRISITAWNQLSITVKFPRNYDPETTGPANNQVLERSDTSRNGNTPIWTPNGKDPEEYGRYTATNIGVCPDSVARERFNTIANGLASWKQIYIDFLNAYQVSGLTPGHVKSYMKWLRATEIEGEYISKEFPKLAGGAPIIGDSDELRALLRNGKWTEYRSTFATIVGLINRMFNELPEEYLVIFSANTRQLVMEALDAPHSEQAFRAIPTIVLAYAYCWNVVTERNLEGLWSGKRAFEELSYAEAESMKNILLEAKSKIRVWESGVFNNITALPSSLRDV